MAYKNCMAGTYLRRIEEPITNRPAGGLESHRARQFHNAPAPAATGTPGAGLTCNGDIRYIGEGTLGFWHKIYQGERGRIQWGVQYSYLFKTGWSGSNGLTGTTVVAPHAVDNMVLTSFRYYLP